MAKRHRKACLELSIGRSRLIVTVLLLVSTIFISSSLFNPPVSAAPAITLNRTNALRGSLVTFTGSGFLSADTDCFVTLQDRTSTNVTVPFTQVCSKSSGSTSLSGSFVVPFVTPILNPYIVIVTGNVTGSENDAALAAFTITAITMSPTTGPRATTVSVNGSLGGSDTTCSITGTVVGTVSCVISGSTGGNFTGSFVVANVVPGPYTVRVTGSPSAIFVEATFIVTGPSIALFPSSGAIGTVVNANGTGFSFTDTTCIITSPSLGGVVVTPGCAINAGTGIVNGTFTVGYVAPGSYVIRITGSSSDFAQATFHVTSGPSITLSPTLGPSGTIVGMTGTGFLPGDKSCTIAGTVVTIPACSIVQGSGAPTGSFTVANVAPGTYVVTVTGNGGDSAQATFHVTVNGTLTLLPTKGPTGTTVTFRATGFLATDTACVVLSAAAGFAPGSNNLLIGSFTCSMSSQVATGSFVVGSLATTNVNWNVTVRGTPANDIPTGVWALFNVTAQITVSPTTGTNGTVVGVTGTGFSSTASTVCTLGITPSTGFTDRLCGISGSTGHASASFRVSTAVPGLYLVNVTDSNGYFAGATFQVGTPSANITINPNAVFAPPGGSVGISGSGFNPYDTSCTITPIVFLFSVSSCSTSSGFVGASLTVLNNAPPGLYAITVTGNMGDFAFNYLGVNTVTVQTSTTLTTTTVATSSTGTTITTSTTQVSTSFSTTTLQTTGFSTWIFTSRTATTAFGQTTTSVISTYTTSSIITALTSTTVTISTIITHTLGQIIQPSTSPHVALSDAITLLGVLSLALPLLIRRFHA